MGVCGGPLPRSWRESGGTDGGGVAETVREAGGDDPWVVASWYEGSVVVQGLAPERWRGRASVPEHSEGKAAALREESVRSRRWGR